MCFLYSRFQKKNFNITSKHEVLTEKELSYHHVNHQVMAGIEAILCNNPRLTPDKINILDWGCGRGRSVAKLREKGFNAFGVEIDLDTMKNGFSLFEQRGFSPTELMKPLNEISCFSDGYFHLIFSEQVFEHVADLPGVIAEQARITAPGGMGVHCFPGANNVWEPHLFMPFVHWLPKKYIRKYWIAAMLLLSFGPPKSSWPETNGKAIPGQADVYYKYINKCTYYRDNQKIRGEFEKFGFNAECTISKKKVFLKKLFPVQLNRNGFPYGAVTFVVKRI